MYLKTNAKIIESLSISLYSDSQPNPVKTIELCISEKYKISYIDNGSSDLKVVIGKFKDFESTNARSSGILGLCYTPSDMTIQFDCSTEFNSDIKKIKLSDIRDIERVTDFDFSTITPTPTAMLDLLYDASCRYVRTVPSYGLDAYDIKEITVFACKEALTYFNIDKVEINDAFNFIYKPVSGISGININALEMKFVCTDIFGKNNIPCVMIKLNSSNNKEDYLMAFTFNMADARLSNLPAEFKAFAGYKTYMHDFVKKLTIDVSSIESPIGVQFKEQLDTFIRSNLIASEDIPKGTNITISSYVEPNPVL